MFIKRELVKRPTTSWEKFNNAVWLMKNLSDRIQKPYRISLATLAELNHGRKTFSKNPNDDTPVVCFYGEDLNFYALWQTEDGVFHLRQIKPRNGEAKDVGYYITQDCISTSEFSDLIKYMIGYEIY